MTSAIRLPGVIAAKHQEGLFSISSCPLCSALPAVGFAARNVLCASELSFVGLNSLEKSKAVNGLVFTGLRYSSINDSEVLVRFLGCERCDFFWGGSDDSHNA